MKDFLIVSSIGVVTFISGILLLKREKRLFSNSVMTQAIVVEYYEYIKTTQIDDVHDNCKMYTMVVEYKIKDGTVIRAKEQSGSSSKKYAPGEEITVVYSEEKPDMFIVKGDHSRKIALWGMIVIGLAMTFLGLAILNS